MRFFFYFGVEGGASELEEIYSSGTPTLQAKRSGSNRLDMWGWTCRSL